MLAQVGSIRTWSRRPGFDPRLSNTKAKIIGLGAALLDTQHYNVRIKGKWSNPGKGVASSQHFGVGAIEKGSFGSPTTTVANLYTRTLNLKNLKRII